MSQKKTDPNEQEIQTQIENVARKVSGERGLINKETAIYHDLAIAGDDADELLAELVREFQVDAKNFDFTEYFPNESERVMWFALNKLGFRKAKFRRMTVGDLTKAILDGQLR